MGTNPKSKSLYCHCEAAIVTVVKSPIPVLGLVHHIQELIYGHFRYTYSAQAVHSIASAVYYLLTTPSECIAAKGMPELPWYTNLIQVTSYTLVIVNIFKRFNLLEMR